MVSRRCQERWAVGAASRTHTAPPRFRAGCTCPNRPRATVGYAPVFRLWVPDLQLIAFPLDRLASIHRVGLRKPSHWSTSMLTLSLTYLQSIHQDNRQPRSIETSTFGPLRSSAPLGSKKNGMGVLRVHVFLDPQHFSVAYLK